jgi:hypothetical protein
MAIIIRLFKEAWLSIAASIFGVFLVRLDKGPYFGSWFYLLLFVAVSRKASRWLNLSIFGLVNALAFGWAEGSFWLGIILAVPAVVVMAACLRRMLCQQAETPITTTGNSFPPSDPKQKTLH